MATTSSREEAQATEATVGILALTTGETFRVARRAASTTTGATSNPPTSTGGVIYTEHEMPALEALLQQYRVAVAVLEREQEVHENEQRPATEEDRFVAPQGLAVE